MTSPLAIGRLDRILGAMNNSEKATARAMRVPIGAAMPVPIVMPPKKYPDHHNGQTQQQHHQYHAQIPRAESVPKR